MKDDLDADVPLDCPPSRIVSLVPALTEAVAVTAAGLLVGATDYCTHPPGLDVSRVGGSKYPRLDAVLDLRPELVLANSEENRPGDVAALREAGIAVWVMAAPATVAMALNSLRALFTRAFAVPVPDWLVQADRLWRDERPTWARAVVPVWRKPWVVLGRDTFGGDVLRRLGVEHAYADHAERYPRPKLTELREKFDSGEADLLVLPDEPYEFTADDGPDSFPGVPYVLLSGRYLTWYGPSLVAGHAELARSLAAARV
ncbi:ABC-type Fe3+-hydroxamate transport system substrate-binding protein [Saccharomonospora amisosensis]|uniref:ABC-type Fe3+-hydroxamate transport system substrate-binding protein n=1 Tax=Saccharomonospora amisosensis TaxID=1128677 RepID=A0A7X5ZSG0_9PSEU|nr:helical backbone metal receptor [Saccharomonospora amisosensis]NIJ13883.1 ABC-type Fe3+-hydroxamate transport system substrate-binding protein [Saccharomonospora amisosensis]